MQILVSAVRGRNYVFISFQSGVTVDAHCHSVAHSKKSTPIKLPSWPSYAVLRLVKLATSNFQQLLLSRSLRVVLPVECPSCHKESAMHLLLLLFNYTPTIQAYNILSFSCSFSPSFLTQININHCFPHTTFIVSFISPTFSSLRLSWTLNRRHNISCTEVTWYLSTMETMRRSNKADVRGGTKYASMDNFSLSSLRDFCGSCITYRLLFVDPNIPTQRL